MLPRATHRSGSGLLAWLGIRIGLAARQVPSGWDCSDQRFATQLIGRRMEVILGHLGHEESVDEVKPLSSTEDSGLHHRLVLIDGHTIERHRDPPWVRQ